MTDRFKNQYRIASTRLPQWDYAAAGYYFITICTQDRVCHFGSIENETTHHFPAGEIVVQEWLKTPTLRRNVILDEWVLMPNHLHGIIQLVALPTNPIEAPRQGVYWRHGILGAIINQFKSVCTKRIHAAGFPDFAWQSRFYDRIIRDEISLQKARAYIANNPLQWVVDHEKEDGLWM